MSGSPTIESFATTGELLAAAESELLAREVWYALPLAVARTCRDEPARYAPPHYAAAVRDEAGRVVGVALMTPPHRLQLYVESDAAAHLVAEDLERGGWRVPGLHGPAPAAAAFAAAWCPARGLRAETLQRLRLFELTRVVPPPRPRGAMRVAGAADAEFVVGCYRAFERETHTGLAESLEDVAHAALRAGRVFVWDDGGPVAQAAIQGETARGARVGAVYTPPERRRGGYATALVAALSQHLLDSGRRWCSLFTDLANPISNSIYAKIGYVPLADLVNVDFHPTAPA